MGAYNHFYACCHMSTTIKPINGRIYGEVNVRSLAFKSS